MSNNRREFIKGSLLGGAAIAAASVPGVTAATEHKKSHKVLDILVLGGTGFIGPHMVREALRRGHSVTLFNRGRTNNALFPDLETIKGDRGGDLTMLEGRKWDAVIDNSGYVPRHVQNSAATLSKNVGQYLYISTISVYDSLSAPTDEDAKLATIEDESVEEVTGATYGPLKALCEKRAQSEVDADRLTILRPTYIAGPGDHTDRFSYWAVRASKGGEMLLPGGADYPLQVIDVRDLANFTIDCLGNHQAGIYNTVTPVGSMTIGSVLDDSLAVSASTVEPVWVDEAFAVEAEKDNTVRNWGMLPIWHALSGDDAAASSVSGQRARAAGLHNRPIRETIRDLLTWWDTLPEERTATMRAGMTPEQEAELIAAWKTRNA
ncbi:MAG: NAD-dependent epimerase/dehydratase family protein [Woeseiaceae bacterium]